MGAVTAAALASELASRDASISGLQASKADASALTVYALQSTVDTSSEVDSKIAAALLNAITTAALDAALLGKADASALASLLSTVDGLDTPLEVDTKIANALLGLATEAFVAAQLACRDASITVQARQPLRGVAGRQAPPGRAAGAAADGGAVREGQPITRAALQRSCRAVRGDCARGHGGACGAAEHSGLDRSGFL